MTALLQQLQHMLEAWDAAEEAEKFSEEIVRTGLNSVGERHKCLFITSVDCAVDVGGSNTGNINVADLNGGVKGSDRNNSDAAGNCSPAAVQAGGEYPVWLNEVQCGGGHDSDSGHDNNVDGTATVDLTGAHAGSVPTRDHVTKLELSRAVLALFTSNAGIYRPVLRRTLGFLFELIDELMDTVARTRRAVHCTEVPAVPIWTSAENEEVAAAHERMRVMEARMSKLVEEASTQRDHLKAEITAHEAREAKLEELLKHQIELVHMNAAPNDISMAAQSKKKDAIYLKKLIARAEDEKAIDELQQEVESLQQERANLSRSVQDLLELNGRYAMQSIELSTRLRILSDHNIGIALEGRKKQNEILLEKRRNDEHLRDLQIARNVVMSAFVNRQHAVANWWSQLRERGLERSAKTILRISDDFNKYLLPVAKLKEAREAQAALRAQTDSGENDADANNVIAACSDDETLYHLWLTPAGSNPYTPEHLRSVSSVDYLRTNPLFAERVIRVILLEWDKEDPRVPLDVFTRNYLFKMASSTDEELSPSLDNNERALAAQKRCLQIAYALDAISRSGCCGSLTYAFGLVTRGKVNECLFRMLEFDGALLLSVCRFLDMERSSPGEPRGLIPVVQFASILVAMYPSYPLFRIEQLLNAARNDGGNRTQSPVLLHYTVLLPERMNIGSVAVSVENAGALWDTSFAHILYKCICDDVEESWQTVEDSFYTYARRYGIASESQLMYKAFKTVPDEDARVWVPALRAGLRSWSELRQEKASVVLEELPRVPVKEAVAYLRTQMVIRRGTRSISSVDHTLFIAELRHQWDSVTGGHVKINFIRYNELVDSVDAKRPGVWVCNSSFTGDMFRYVGLSERVTARELLERLQHQEEATKQAREREREKEREDISRV